ncbi:MAG TPA: hypothetical protein DD473_22505 [Planctomycetaceae bacterium]|nr:hypothetical protein [Planctomycetaceae bacterium]
MKSYSSLLVVVAMITFHSYCLTTLAEEQITESQNKPQRLLSFQPEYDLRRDFSAELWGQNHTNSQGEPLSVEVDTPTAGKISKLVEAFPMIELINFRNASDVKDEEFKAICQELMKLKNLTSFMPSGVIIQSEMQAKAIGELEGLKYIDLQLGNLPLEALNQLSKLTKVTAIQLRVRNKNDDAIAAAIIRRFPLLTEMKLSGLGIGPQTFDAIGSAKSLSTLWLKPYIDVDGEVFAHLLKCRQLQKLWIRCHAISNWYPTIGRLETLKQLSISGECSDHDMSHLDSLHQLEFLNIVGGSYTDLGLAKLHGLTKLEYLRLVNSKLTGSAFRELSELDQLKELHLGHTNFAPENGPYLAELESLEYLDLAWTPLAWSNDWESLVPLARLQHLREIWIDFKDKPAYELSKRLSGVTIEYYE